MALKIGIYGAIGVLSKPMKGKEAYRILRKEYGYDQMHAQDTMRTSFRYGICAKFPPEGREGFVAVHQIRNRRGTFYVIEDGTSPKKVRADPPERVARARPVRYSSGVARVSSSAPSQTNKEPVMVARTAARKAAPAKVAAKAPVRKAKAAPEPEPEDLELEEELEDEELEDELEDEEDEDLEDEDESDEDEDEEEDEEDEEGDEEDEDEESEATDYTPYASKAITPVMEDFARWIDEEIFQPTGTSIADVGAEDPVRLIAIAGTVRMEFQKSDFNREQREKRQKAAASAKAAPKAVAKAVPAAKKAAPAKPAAKVAAKPTARPAAKPAAKAAPAKAAPAASRGPRTATRKKGPAPY